MIQLFDILAFKNSSEDHNFLDNLMTPGFQKYTGQDV
jgi:hypothetical protein